MSGARPAPERRRAEGGGWEVRVRDRWLPADEPSTMVEWNEWQDGIERASAKLARPGPATPPAPVATTMEPVALDGLQRGKGARGATTVLLDGQWIALAAVEAWNAYLGHRTVLAAAEALGISPDRARERIRRFETVYGVERPPEPRPEPEPRPASARLSAASEPVPAGHPWRDPRPASASEPAEEAPPTPEPVSHVSVDHASDLHRPEPVLRPLVTMHLPLDMRAVAGVLKAVARAYPSAVVDEQGRVIGPEAPS